MSVGVRESRAEKAAEAVLQILRRGLTSWMVQLNSRYDQPFPQPRGFEVERERANCQKFLSSWLKG